MINNPAQEHVHRDRPSTNESPGAAAAISQDRGGDSAVAGQPIPEGTTPGLPRPRIDGRPVPWITALDPSGRPDWLHIHPDRHLRCQTDWTCQICGQPLPRRSWVVLNPDGKILSDSAMHQPCLSIARRWCPYLATPDANLTPVRVSPSDVLADQEPLDTIADYGREARGWTLATTRRRLPYRR